MADITVSSDVDTMLQSANNAAIISNIGAAPSDTPTFTGSSNFNGNVDFNSTVLADNGLGVTGDITVSSGKIITGEIQSQGTSSDKIFYDSREHRFRDFDSNPNDLTVIKMIPGEGARVGINEDNPKCALHVIQEGSSGYPDNEAIRCTGGLRISQWLRLGPYTDSERDAIGLDPPPGLMIYNEEHYEVQVFIANPSGSGRGSWKAFTLQDVST